MPLPGAWLVDIIDQSMTRLPAMPCRYLVSTPDSRVIEMRPVRAISRMPVEGGAACSRNRRLGLARAAGGSPRPPTMHIQYDVAHHGSDCKNHKPRSSTPLLEADAVPTPTLQH